MLMSKDISQGKKANDFAEAVKGLLGLNAIFTAIQHFKPTSKYGVIGSYESSYDAHSNTKIQEYTAVVQRCKDRIAQIDARIEELEGQIESARARKSEKVEEIKTYAEGEKLQKTYNTDIVDSVLNACLGVVSAVDRYDPDTSGPFASYASIWALQFVSRLQPTQNPHIYYPTHRQESYYAVYPLLKSHGCLECSDLASCPHASEMICEKIGCRPEEIDDLIMALQPPVSYEEYLEEVLRDDPAGEFFCDNYPWAEYVPELDMFDSVANSEVKRMIKEALEKLTPREEEIVVARFGLDGSRPKTLEEIGQIRGVTRERVRQIEKKALRKLIHPARSRALRDLVEPRKRGKVKKVKTPRRSS